ncbi:MAG: hypothetical protein ACP5MZ_01660 [Candidatus Micrarchaeia archaeon]
MTINPDTDLLIFRERIEKGEFKPSGSVNIQHEAAPVQPVENRAMVEPRADSGNEYRYQQIGGAPAASGGPALQQVGRQQSSTPTEANIGEVAKETYVPPSEGYTQVEAALGNILGASETESLMGDKEKRITKSEREEREAAEGMYCVWHPWRSAYAICHYCHRPFCFEDLVESNGNYYCLEDIDKAGAEQESSGEIRKLPLNLNLVSGIIFMLPMVIVLLFSGNGLAEAITFAQRVGFFTFISNVTFAYAAAMIEMLLAFFCLIAGILIFVSSKKSTWLGLSSDVITSIFFLYVFVNTHELYALAGAAIMLAGLAILVYSRVTYQPSVEELSKELEANKTETPMEFPNAGRF